MRVLSRKEDLGDGVERLHFSRAWPGGAPMYWTSCYRTGNALVDSGHVYARRELARFLDERPVEIALATHEHEDHVGNYRLLVERGVTALAPRAAVERLEAIADGRAKRLPFYRAVTWGNHDGARGARVANGVVRGGGRAFRVVHTPGHSEEHVALLDEDSGALFTGDLVLGKLKVARRVEDIPVQMDSMRAVLDLGASVVYPAHGPVLTKPNEQLGEILAHLDGVQRRAHAMAARGKSTRSIARDLLGREGVMTFVSAGAFSKRNLVESLLTRAPA